MSIKIGIVGANGFVGRQMDSFFYEYTLKNNNLSYVCYDISYKEGNIVVPLKEKCIYTNNINYLNKCDFIFVCVPTPSSSKDGSCDISIVENVVKDLENIQVGIIVIKSTVPPGTCDYLSVKYNVAVVFSPEYAGENKYRTRHNFLSTVSDSSFFVFGGEKTHTRKVVELYQTIAGPEKQYIQTTAKVAEMAKYVNNSFFAIKVAFCNELYDLCNSVGIDYNEVREIWNKDPRNTPDFSCVFNDNRGFGGKCFPKDTLALNRFADSKGERLLTLDAAIKSNNRVRAKNV